MFAVMENSIKCYTFRVSILRPLESGLSYGYSRALTKFKDIQDLEYSNLIHSGSFIINLFIYWIFHSINQQQAAGIGSTKLTMNNSNWKWRRFRFREIFMVFGQSSWISGFSFKRFDWILWCLSKIYSPNFQK